MHVEDRLSCFGTRIENEPPGFTYTRCRSHLGCDHCELTCERRVGGGQLTEIGIVIARYDEDVRRSVRSQIPERDDPVGLANDVGRQLPRHDPAEHAVGHRGPRGLVK